MRFGMLHLFENPIDKTEYQVVKEQLELMVAAEEYGFDSIWPAEHHFTEYGYCASPSLSLAAVASVTKKVRLGTGVVVLPMNHPLRLAEDYAFLDLMSDGRVDFGMGRGYQPLEFQRYGIDQATTRGRFEECVDVIKMAWQDGVVDFHGDYYDFTNVPVRPSPLQTPQIPMWMACLSPESFEMAGDYGHNLLFGSVFGIDPETATQRRIDYYRGLARSGHSAEDKQVGCLMMVYVAETKEKAEAEYREVCQWYFNTVAKYLSTEGDKPIKTYEAYHNLRDVAASADFDMLREAGFVVCGSPDQVVEELTQAQQGYAMTELLCWTRLGGLDNNKVLKSMELMRDRVFPHLRDLSLPPIPEFEDTELTSTS